jgi:hypothetical protein
MTKKILAVLIHPAFLSLVISIPIIVVLPSFDKYRADLEVRERYTNGHSIYYADLNRDGQSEKIDINTSYPNQVSVIVSHNNKILNQWNFSGQKVQMTPPFWGDLDNDNIDEISLFIYRDGKILLNCFNPIKNKLTVKDKFVSHYTVTDVGLDCSVRSIGFYDNNKDNNNEFYFSLISGFNSSPRKICGFDFANDKINYSPESCFSLTWPFACDINNDGLMEFGASTNAPGNCDGGDLNDSFTWFFLLNKDLEFLFEPVKVGSFPSVMHVVPINIMNELKFASLNIYQGAEKFPSAFTLFNQTGNVEKKVEFEYSEEWKDATIINNNMENNGHIYLVKKSGTIEEKDAHFNTLDIKKINPLFMTESFAIDIDKNNKNEFVFFASDRDKLILTRNNFSHPVEIEIFGNNSFSHCSLFSEKNKKNKLYIACDNYSYVYNYFQNPFYYFQYVIYCAIYAAFLLLILLLQRLQKYRVEKKYQAEKKIAELQIKSIKNQIDPHFTLNIINSIGALFGKNDTEQADYIFGKYSKLLRATITNSDQILTSLKAEFEYVTHYMDLEKYRLHFGLEYKIKIDESVNKSIEIPKMLIHTFVENAIKHGIRHLNKQGELQLTTVANKTDYLITIKDNGVGREKAKQHSQFSTYQGLNILEQILDLYYDLQKKRITFEISDMYDDNKFPTGTKVEIRIPQ